MISQDMCNFYLELKLLEKFQNKETFNKCVNCRKKYYLAKNRKKQTYRSKNRSMIFRRIHLKLHYVT